MTSAEPQPQPSSTGSQVRANAPRRTGSKGMLDLASTLSHLPEALRPAPWAGYEYVKGWAVFGLPFDSGHMLALRVMPESSIALPFALPPRPARELGV